MSINNNYTLTNVWENKSDALKEEIVNFWLRERALGSREQAAGRVNQVAMIARDSFGELVGICTVYPRRHPQLRHNFYHFRTFVGAMHRQNLIAAQFAVQTRDYFNDRFVAGHDQHIIGILVEAENEILKTKHTLAIWPHSGMVFVGYNQRGDHIRVFYFDGARIQPG
ncbi:MAG: hypothetical protein AAF614_18450 [Chloroflexota bacterium]